MIRNQPPVGRKAPTRFATTVIASIGFLAAFQLQPIFKPFVVEWNFDDIDDLTSLPTVQSNVSNVEELPSIPKPSSNSEAVSFPETKFTPHVREIVGTIESKTLSGNGVTNRGYWPELYCFKSARIVVEEPFTAPSRIECKESRKVQHFCNFMKQLFKNKTIILPYNISLGLSFQDYDNPSRKTWGNCISSSAPKGLFTMTNSQDIQNQVKKRDNDGYIFSKTVEWEKRQKIPVFRGHPRLPEKREWKVNGCPKAGELSPRVKVADWSFYHPDLLDAAVAYRGYHVCKHTCCTQNKTDVEGIDRIFRRGPYSERNRKYPNPATIDSAKYFTKYQTTVVLGGVGAAFRTARHLAAGQAVVLQDWAKEEWFVPYMKPLVHYIPLQKDLSDLKETMEWVRDNPSEVKKIAEQGYQFYWDYLSFVQTEKHFHELLWRLSIAAHENGLDRLKYGTGRGIWPAPIFPLGYERGPHGNWVDVDIATELVKEDAALEEMETPLLYLPDQWQGGAAMNKSKVKMKGGERGWTGGY